MAKTKMEDGAQNVDEHFGQLQQLESLKYIFLQQQGNAIFANAPLLDKIQNALRMGGMELLLNIKRSGRTGPNGVYEYLDLTGQTQHQPHLWWYRDTHSDLGTVSVPLSATHAESTRDLWNTNLRLKPYLEPLRPEHLRTRIDIASTLRALQTYPVDLAGYIRNVLSSFTGDTRVIQDTINAAEQKLAQSRGMADIQAELEKLREMLVFREKAETRHLDRLNNVALEVKDAVNHLRQAMESLGAYLLPNTPILDTLLLMTQEAKIQPETRSLSGKRTLTKRRASFSKRANSAPGKLYSRTHNNYHRRQTQSHRSGRYRDYSTPRPSKRRNSRLDQ